MMRFFTLSALTCASTAASAVSLKKTHHIITLRFSEVVNDHAKYRYIILNFIALEFPVQKIKEQEFQNYFCHSLPIFLYTLTDTIRWLFFRIGGKNKENTYNLYLVYFIPFQVSSPQFPPIESDCM